MRIDDAALGSPLALFLANVFLGKIKKTDLKDIGNDLDFYSQYMNNISCLIGHNTATKTAGRMFNSAHSSLKYFQESETDNEVAFLDVLLYRQEDGSFQRRIYRKKP
ncbi:unnamed protein product [Dibothriocephalus latus]|uniref:Reverse transcriptase domain-containing protein n=1 Tax=Dibothriocephalus latus TaxID=60516 RepID=A0A3P6QB39_DIBLA|nr:unnamed protein product [Dibothriocephalus latus]